MKTIAIFTPKGGTSKTTSTFNIAGCLAKQGKKVLVIDADRQQNLTRRFLSYQLTDGLNYFYDKNTLEHLFMSPKEINDAIYPVMFPTKSNGQIKRRGIDIIFCSPVEFGYTPNAETLSLSLMHGGVEKGNFKKALDNIRKTRTHMYEYDYCLIDFHPAYNEFAKEILKACDYIIAPIEADENSSDGIAQEIADIKQLTIEENTNVKLLGFYLARVKKTGNYAAQKVESIKEDLGDYAFNTIIIEDDEVKWSLEAGVPLAWAKRNAPVTKAYYNLIEEIERKIV